MSEEKIRNSLRAGYKLHWYQIQNVLGQGGFGITYLAQDTNLDQPVAIKEYLPLELVVREGEASVHPASQSQTARYQWGLDRFLAEARTLARFKHPSIVRVMSVFEANNTAYMVMEYQQGQTLQQVLERRPTLPEAALMAMLSPLLDGLEVIHAQHFIHRDIKPANLFIRTDRAPVLLDFGSARQALGGATQTLTSVVSPGYAPFEQYYSKSDRQGPWTDIYGLGATLYRCISGQAPMTSIDRSEAILKAERDIFISASEIGARQYSERFLAAIDSALHFNEKHRPQTVAAWRREFELSGSASASVARPRPEPEDDAPTRFDTFLSERVDAATEARSASDVASGNARMERPASAAHPVAPTYRLPRRVIAVIAALTVLVIGAWQLHDRGVLPDFISIGGEARERQALLVAGDRALAAGQVYEPADASALFYYRHIHDARPGDDAARGLRIVGQRLREDAMTALASDELVRAEALAALLQEVPSEFVDDAPVKAAVAAARIQARERERQATRVAEFLGAAAAEVTAGRLLGAGTDNALAKYRAVQILDPGNAAAASGIEQLAVALAAQGEAAVDAGKIEDAATLLQQARMLHRPAAIALAERVEGAERLAAKQADLDALLRAAKVDITAQRLTSPPGNNALERYRQVLERTPDNPDAKRGIQQIHDIYIASARAAVNAEQLEQANALVDKVRLVQASSPQLAALEQDIVAAREHMAEEAALAQAVTAEVQAKETARLRAEEERARVAAQAALAQRQEAEALRLFAAAQAKAAEEQRLADEANAGQAIAVAPYVVLDFHGFDAKYESYSLIPERIIAAIRPVLDAAGYTIVPRAEGQSAGSSRPNLRLIVFRLTVNENTATGLYSYAGSVNVFEAAALGMTVPQALATPPFWTRSHHGFGPPSDLHALADRFTEMTQQLVQNLPALQR